MTKRIFLVREKLCLVAKMSEKFSLSRELKILEYSKTKSQLWINFLPLQLCKNFLPHLAYLCKILA